MRQIMNRGSRWLPWPRMRRNLSDVVAANIARPDPAPTPPVDLLQILMGQSDV